MKKTLTKQNKKSIVLFVLLAIIMLFSCLGIERLSNKANASEPQVSVQEWKDEYVLNSTWTAPTDAKVQIGSTSYDVTTSYLVFPDGKIYCKDSYTLSQAGGYTAHFFAKVNGKEVSASKTFYVYNSAHNVPEGAFIEYKDELLMDNTRSGLYVKVPEGTAYEYGSTIDISNADLSTPIATLHSFNSSIVDGAAGFNKIQTQILVLRLTDAYNEKNYVDIELSYDVEGSITNTSLWAQGWFDTEKMKAYKLESVEDDENTIDDESTPCYDEETKSYIYQAVTQENVQYLLKDEYTMDDFAGTKIGDYRYGRYFRAGTSKVLPKGFQVNATGKKTSWPVIEYEDAYYDVCRRTDHLGNIWGPYGASGEKHNPFGGSDPVEFYFDYETCKVFAKTYSKSGIAKTSLVADLRCKDAFDVPFEGFTTGEVRLSVFGQWYKESYLEFEISSIYGLTGDALKLDNTAHETNKPIIKTSVTNEENGEIAIAKDEPFTIFPYEIWDVSDIAEQFVKVYYQYGSNKQIAVGVKDGKFTPKNVGEYTLVYGAKDIYGNYSEAYVNLNSVVCDNNESLYLGFASDGDLELGDTVQEVSIGKTYHLPTPEIRNENPFDVKLVISILKDGKKTIIDNEINAFTLYELGEFTLCYEYQDIVQSKVTTYKVNSVPSNEVALLTTPTMPKYFIKDTVTSLEVGKTISFEFDGVEVEPNVEVSFDGGEYEQVDPTGVEITAEENVMVKYSYGEKTLFETPNPIPVIDVGYANEIRLADYFLGDFEADVNATRIKFTANEESGDAALNFINPISMKSFQLYFEIQEATANFQTLEITLTDYYDKNNFVTLIYGKTPIGISYQIGDAKYQFTTQNFASSSVLSYDNTNQQFTTYAGDAMPFKNIFTKDKVYLTINLHKMTGESAINISQINSQLFNDSYDDYTNADISVVDVDGTFKLGSTLTIHHPHITDVLSPYVEKNFLITIETPADAEGKVGYYEANGITYRNVPMTSDTLEIQLDRGYGRYRVRFIYTDSDYYGNRDQRLIDVFVTDDEIPVLHGIEEFNGKTFEAEFGKAFVIKGCTATDNVTAPEDLYLNIIVIAPDSHTLKVNPGDVYTIYRRGVYTVYYMCYDKAGNYALAHYYVHVK